MSGRWLTAVLPVGVAGGIASAGPAASLPSERAAELAAEAGARHHRIEVGDLFFRPAEADVAPGDTITWLNVGVVPHTVTAADAAWDSGELAPGQRFTLVVGAPGDTPYVCRYHPTMNGRLVAD